MSASRKVMFLFAEFQNRFRIPNKTGFAGQPLNVQVGFC